MHLVGERALGIHDGLWGSIAAGALFDSITVLGGRQRHDRRRRSDDVRRRHARSLRMAEVVVGVLQQSLERDGATVAAELGAARAVTETGPSPWSAEQAAAAVAELRALRERWRALAVGEGVGYSWPSPARGGRRGRGTTR